MTRTQPTSDETPPPHRLQFGLGSMFLLTAACAVICAVTAALDAPVVFRLVAACYFALLAAYGTLRLPTILRRLRWALRRRRELQIERERFCESQVRAAAMRRFSERDGASRDNAVE